MKQSTFNEYKAIFLKAISSIEDTKARTWAKSLISGNQKGQKVLLKELLSRHQEISEWLFGDIESFVKTQVDTRNRFTHRGPLRERTRSDWEDLYWQTEIILLLCYCIVADFIGIGKTKILSAIDENGFKSNVKYQAWRLFPKIKDGNSVDKTSSNMETASPAEATNCDATQTK